MVSGSTDIREGMEVLDCSGQKLGKVSRVFSGAPMENTASDTDAGMTSDPGADAGGSYGTSGTANTYGAPGDSASGEGNVGAFGMAVDTVTTDNVGSTVGGSSDLGFTGPNTGATGPSTERFESTGALDTDIGTAGAAALTPSDTKYFEVHHGGVLGFGGSSLYIPFSAVEVVSPGDSVTINCTADEAGQAYAQEPAPLETTADTTT